MGQNMQESKHGLDEYTNLEIFSAVQRESRSEQRRRSEGERERLLYTINFKLHGGRIRMLTF